MSQLTATQSWSPEYESAVPPADSFVEPKQRPILQPILLLIPLVLSLAGWAGGGAMFLTDMAFLVLAILCSIFLIQELMCFSERYGIGAFVLFGGVLIWFCYDYFKHWFGQSPTSPWMLQYGAKTVAHSAMCHMLFILLMTLGLRLRWGRWLPKLMTKLPEPRSIKTYFWVIVLAQLTCFVLPYVLFNSEPFPLAVYHSIVGGRSGQADTWITGRTGNANYSFGAYLAQVLQVALAASLLAAFYAIFLSRSRVEKIICWVVWTLHLLLGFGTGARGTIAFQIVPVIAFFFIRYHVEAADVMRRFSLKAYVAVVVSGVLALVLIQTQIQFRNSGFEGANLSDVDLTEIQGNMMFSEGLAGFMYIPDHHDVFFNHFPGEAILLPIPNSIFWFFISPMPRALWTTKPVDPVGPWYSDIATGGNGESGGSVEGTTVSEGLVGYWYFRFGYAGVIEGGLLFGWLMGCCERALLNNRGRTMAVLFALGVTTWLFRCYRDFSFNELNVTLVGLAGLSFFILLLRPFSTSSPQT